VSKALKVNKEFRVSRALRALKVFRELKVYRVKTVTMESAHTRCGYQSGMREHQKIF